MIQPIAGARCALHPERDAIGTCRRCGNFACVECSASGFHTGTLCVTCQRTAVESRYHVVPMWRFLLLSVLTFGAYQMYWFWKNWTRVKRADGSDIWPIPRALFAGFTYFSLLTDLNTQLVARESKRHLSSGLAVGFILAGILYRLPDPYSLLSLTTILFLTPAVTAMRELASEAAIAEGARWQLRHTLLLLAAVPFFTLAVLGLTMPDEP